MPRNFNKASTSHEQNEKSRFTKTEKAMAIAGLAMMGVGGIGAATANHLAAERSHDAQAAIESIQEDFSEADDMTSVGEVLQDAAGGGDRFTADNIALAMQLHEKGNYDSQPYYDSMALAGETAANQQAQAQAESAQAYTASVEVPEPPILPRQAEVDDVSVGHEPQVAPAPVEAPVAEEDAYSPSEPREAEEVSPAPTNDSVVSPEIPYNPALQERLQEAKDLAEPIGALETAETAGVVAALGGGVVAAGAGGSALDRSMRRDEKKKSS